MAKALTAWIETYRTAADSEARLITNEDGSPLDMDHAAERFRAHLKAAGVDRPELYERAATRMAIRVHDLWATFVTLSLAHGRSETWVSDRTGHKSSQMLQRYKRAVRAAQGRLAELTPLPEAIPELEKAAKAQCTSLGVDRRV